MIAFGIFLLALGLAAGLSLTGYTILRLVMGNTLDTSIGLMWEAVMHTPYQPMSGRVAAVGLMVSFALCAIGALLVRPERKSQIRRVVAASEPPKPPA